MRKSIKKRGRPPGMRSAQLDLQLQLYEHPNNRKVIETIYRIALDDEHKHQAAAQKLLMDRMLPVSTCDKSSDFQEQVTIHIRSVEIPEPDKPEIEVIEGEEVLN